ncbi:transketolase [Ichthyobacterium seriolicida]|uniref:Transketolase, N-terminal section n=1 Tax=Ichthyobacterium seriolicida TaxID=242600 RepID=A0A1J1E740_9FLAO|nr:transketolase [Ichthyobacterium seriolicida]BAV95158.1 transketolase, N-terminal section [Ichthyobacterium seriolicida]
MSSSISELKEYCVQTRRDILRMVHSAKSGHPGGSLGCTEFMVALYFEIMHHNYHFSIDGTNEDIFFLSNGHISPVLYSVLARSKYFPVSELKTFRRINSRLQGHPTNHTGLPGVRVASGSLGQGMSVAIGAALSKKINGDERLVFSLHGDGEIQEGQIWEAIMYASANKVDNLIATIDVNGRQIDGDTDKVLPMGDISEKFKVFGWEVIELKEGNDIERVVEVLNLSKLKARKNKPVCIIMNTEMGNGVDFMMGTHQWHGIAPNDEQLEKALEQNPETSLKDY